MAPPQCAGASDLVVSIADCAGLQKALPVPMPEDMHLYVDSEGGLVCDSVSFALLVRWLRRQTRCAEEKR